MLKERIEILKNGGVISREVADFVNHTIDVIVKDYPQVNEDAAAMFTTHLAMAAERIRRGEVVDGLDEAVWQDVVECPEYEVGCRLIEQLFADQSVEFPESERKFLMLHICNMLSE